MILDAGGVHLSTLSDELSNIPDRHVIDATGITGIFNLHLEFARDEATRRPPPVGGTPPLATLADDPASGPSIFRKIRLRRMRLRKIRFRKIRFRKIRPELRRKGLLPGSPTFG